MLRIGSAIVASLSVVAATDSSEAVVAQELVQPTVSDVVIPAPNMDAFNGVSSLEVVQKDLQNVYLTHREAILLAAQTEMQKDDVKEAMATYGPVMRARLEKAKNFISAHAIVTESITYLPFPKAARQPALEALEQLKADGPEKVAEIKARIAENPDLSAAYTDFVSVIMTHKATLRANYNAAKQFIADNMFETDDIIFIPIPTSYVPACLATLLSERFEAIAYKESTLEIDGETGELVPNASAEENDADEAGETVPTASWNTIRNNLSNSRTRINNWFNSQNLNASNLSGVDVDSIIAALPTRNNSTNFISNTYDNLNDNLLNQWRNLPSDFRVPRNITSTENFDGVINTVEEFVNDGGSFASDQVNGIRNFVNDLATKTKTNGSA